MVDLDVSNASPDLRLSRRVGWLYLLLIPLGAFSFAYVPSVLFVQGDAVATTQAIAAAPGLFRGASLSHLVSQVLVVFLVLEAHALFAPVGPKLARLMVAFGLLGPPISFLNEAHNFAALRLATGGDDPASVAQVASLLHMARDGVLLAQLFWAGWLLVLGVLVVRSRFLPRLVGMLLVIAGCGYVFDSVAQLLSSGLPVVSPFTALGELAFCLWLLFKGVAQADGS